VLCHVSVFVLGVTAVHPALKLKSHITKSHVFIHAHVSVTVIYIVIDVELLA
jgi:hypothetical protein